MAARRNRKGQFIKGGKAPAKPRARRKSTALARRAPTSVARRRAPSSSRAIARRGGAGGGRRGMLGGVGRWFGSPSSDELIASAGWGWLVGNRRATVDELVSKAPEFVRPVGGFGIGALALGALGELVPGVRRYTAPAARVAANLAVYNLAKRGKLYAAADADLLGADGDDGDASGYIDADEAGAYADDGED